MTAMVLRLDEIEVRHRSRRDLRDLDSLTASIKARGLLHPPVVRADGPAWVLIGGARRLEALRRLGVEQTAVTLADDVSGELAALLAEGEENTERVDFLPSEAVEHARRIEDVEQRAAKQRRREHGGTAPGRSKNTCRNLRQVSGEAAGRSSTKVAKAVGKGETSLRKARRVVEAAEDDSRPEVQQVARAAQQQMDDTGKIDPAFQAVTRAELAAAAVSDFPDLAFYSAQPSKQISLAAELRGCGEIERTARLTTLQLAIETARRRTAEPERDPEPPAPDYYKHAQAMFAAANAAMSTLRKHGGAETFLAACEDDLNPMQRGVWRSQFHSLAIACSQVEDACTAKPLRAVR